MRGSKRTARRSAAVLKRLIQPRPGANLLPKKKKSGRPIAHRESLRCASDRWLRTIQDSKPKTLEQKSYIADRIKKQWPTGSLVQPASNLSDTAECESVPATQAQLAASFSPTASDIHTTQENGCISQQPRLREPPRWQHMQAPA
jgi:hypothetical protein